MKEKVKSKFSHLEIEDVGAHVLDENDDYTTYAGRVASGVSMAKDSRGILFCGSGVGVDIMANKFDGVRSSVGIKPEQVVSGRRDDNMNVLVIAADYTSEDDAFAMIEAFLKSEYKENERYERRLSDIRKIEEIN